jgi:hypothetical protein
MSTLSELEKEILSLAPAERERIAMTAWESLVSDPNTAGSRDLDPEGIQLATQRNAEIEAGNVQPISHTEFIRRTGGSSE